MKVRIRGVWAAILARLSGLPLTRRRWNRPCFSGEWRVNLDRSDFGGEPAPLQLSVTIDHQEPYLRFDGALIDASGEFRSFDATIVLDGRLYRNEDGESTITAEWIDGPAVRSVWTFQDGMHVETALMMLSPDGLVLTVRRSVTSPERSCLCTEIYDRFHPGLLGTLAPGQHLLLEPPPNVFSGS